MTAPIDPCLGWRRAFWAGAALGFLLGLVMAPAAQAGDGTWLGSTVASKHINPGREYNEKHWPSVFLEHQYARSRWSWQAGVYRNSFDRTTWYGLAGYELVRVRFWGQELALAGAAGLGTGYAEHSDGSPSSGLSPMLGLVLEWRMARDFGLNIFFNTAVAAAQPKGRLH